MFRERARRERDREGKVLKMRFRVSNLEYIVGSKNFKFFLF